MTVADALVELALDHEPRRSTSRLRAALRWLSAVSVPPSGVHLVSDDGSRFTGVLVIEDNQPVRMLAVRTRASPHPAEHGADD